MTLVIKKRVSLDFLGEDYKESYLLFKAIPIKDFERLQSQVEESKDSPKKSIELTQNVLKDYFISGKGLNEKGELTDITEADLDELDAESILKIFQILTGQNIQDENDFLDQNSKTPSSTTGNPPSNS